MLKSSILSLLFTFTLYLMQAHVCLRAQAVYINDSSAVYEQFCTNALFYLDKTSGLSIKDVTAPEFAKNWQPYTKGDLSEPITPHYSYWLRLEIKAANDIPNDWLLDSYSTFLDTIEFYRETPSGFIQQRSGNDFTHEARMLKSTYQAFKLNFAESRTQIVYFRTHSRYPAWLPLKLRRSADFYESVLLSEFLYGIFYGIFLIMSLYNLFLYYSIRDKNYLYYVLLMFVSMLVYGSGSGHAFMLLWPDYPFLNRYMVRILMCLLGFCSALFTQSFLQSKKYAPKGHFCLLTLMGIDLFMLVLFATDLYNGPLLNVLLSVQICTMIAVGFTCWQSGNQSARFFILAWIVYLVAGLARAMANMSVLPFNFVTYHGIEVGATLEVLLLSLALADRYKRMRVERENAQKEALRIQKEANENLESKVLERTHELRNANEELNQINEELSQTMDMLEAKTNQLHQRNEAITASIQYAKRIQQAILPSDSTFKQYFDDFFILYLPRDIVSGDFYWLVRKDKVLVVAVADCTGHGVPAALMAMIGNNLLNNIVLENGLIYPNLILQQMNKGVHRVLKQEGKAVNDGMDIAICSIYQEEMRLEYAGAMSPIFLAKEEEFIEIKADKISIGGHSKPTDYFTAHKMRYDTPSMIYLLSDGFQDQFGGAHNKKFMVKKLKNLLYNIRKENSIQQHDILLSAFESWKGEYKQIDDVLILGIRL